MISYSQQKVEDFNQQSEEFYNSLLIDNFDLDQQQQIYVSFDPQLSKEVIFLINDTTHYIQDNGKPVILIQESQYFQMANKIKDSIFGTIKQCFQKIRRKLRFRKKLGLFQKIFQSPSKEIDHKQKQTFINLNKFYRSDLDSQFILSPTGQTRLLWDIFCMILIIYAMLIIPFRLSFENDEEQFPIFDLIDNVVDWIFIADIILNFNTAIFKQGVIVSGRKQIALQYIRFWLWLDLISSLPFGLITMTLEQEEANDSVNTAENIQKGAQILRILKFFKFLKVIKLLRIVKLKVVFERIMEYLELNYLAIYFAEFFKLILIILFLAHVVSCVWHGVGLIDPEQSWMVAYNIQNSGWEEQYLNSFYWSVLTMVAIGYGDITPQNSYEQLVAISVMLLTCAIYGYIIQTVQYYKYKLFQFDNLVRVMQRMTRGEKAELKQCDKYMKRKKINLNMQVRVYKYLLYVQENKRKNMAVQGNLIEQLPHSLKRQLQIYINGRIITKTSFLIQTFSAKLLYQTALILHEQIVSPEETIFFDDNKRDEIKVFYIKEGEISIFLSKTNTQLAILRRKQYFGEIGFFTNHRSASAKALDFSDLFYINRIDFLRLLEKSPRDAQKFHYIKDVMIFNQKILGIHCYICKQPAHVAIQCHFLTALGNRSQQLQQQQRREKQFNYDYQRNMRTRVNPKLILNQLAAAVEKFQMEGYNIDNDIGLETQKDDQALDLSGWTDTIKFNFQRHQEKIDLQQKSNFYQILFSFQGILEYAKKLITYKIKQYWAVNDGKEGIYIERKIKNQNSLLMMEGFENVKNYKHYFPQGNIQKIVTSMNQLNAARLQKVKEEQKKGERLIQHSLFNEYFVQNQGVPLKLEQRSINADLISPSQLRQISINDKQ